MREKRLPIAIPLLGVVLFGFHASGIASGLSPGIRFLLVVLVYIFWPGHILKKHLFRFTDKNPLLGILISFMIGLSTAALIAWIASLASFAGMSFFSYTVLFQVVVLAIYGLSIISTLARPSLPKPPSGEIERIQTSGAYFYAALAVLLGIFLFCQQGRIDVAGDAYDHIGYVRAIQTENDLVPDGVLAPAVEDPPQVKHDPRKGAFHPLFAAVSRYAGLDPVATWLYLPSILGPVAFIAFVLFSCALLPGAGQIFVCALLFLLFQGGIGMESLSTIMYGQSINLIFLWALFTLVYATSWPGRKMPVALILLIFSGAITIHINALVLSGIMIGSLLLFTPWLGLNGRQLMSLVLWSLPIAAGVLACKIFTSYEAANLLHTHRQGLLYLSERFFVVSPVVVLEKNSLVFFGGLLLIPFLFALKRYRSYARICIALSVLPLFICFNPILAPPVYAKGSYLLHRMVQNIPAFQIAVLVLGSLLAWARGNRQLLARLFAVFLVFAWMKLFLFPGKGAVVQNVKQLHFDLDKSFVDPQFKSAIDFAKTKIPRGSVVLSDPVTSYVLGAYADVKVVGILHQHGNPNDPLGMDRLKTCRDVLSPFTSQKESLSLLDKYGVDVVLINGAFEKPVRMLLANYHPAVMSDLKKKYGGLRKSIDIVAESSSLLALRVLAEDTGARSWHPTIPFFADAPTGAVRCDAPVYLKGVKIDAISMEPQVVIPGEMVTITIWYKRDLHYEYGFPVTLVVRFDHEDYFSHRRSWPGDKHVRRVKERRNKTLYRFRRDREVFGGHFPPDMWPIDTSVMESFVVKIPPVTATGSYSVQLKLVEKSLADNFHVRDFLFNNDSYDGISCGKLNVKKSIIR